MGFTYKITTSINGVSNEKIYENIPMTFRKSSSISYNSDLATPDQINQEYPSLVLTLVDINSLEDNVLNAIYTDLKTAGNNGLVKIEILDSDKNTMLVLKEFSTINAMTLNYHGANEWSLSDFNAELNIR